MRREHHPRVVPPSVAKLRVPDVVRRKCFSKGVVRAERERQLGLYEGDCQRDAMVRVEGDAETGGI